MAALAGGGVRFTPAAMTASAAVLLGAALVPTFGSLYVVEVGTTMLLYVVLCLVPLHSGFDGLSVSGIERGQVGAVHLDGDAPSCAGVA